MTQFVHGVPSIAIVRIADELIKVAPRVALVNRLRAIAMLFHLGTLSKLRCFKSKVGRMLALNHKRKFDVIECNEGPTVVCIEQFRIKMVDVPLRRCLRVVDDDCHVVKFHDQFLQSLRTRYRLELSSNIRGLGVSSLCTEKTFPNCPPSLP